MIEAAAPWPTGRRLRLVSGDANVRRPIFPLAGPSMMSRPMERSTRRVITGSRLHFGPLNWPGADHPRPDFGGLGMMVQQPSTIVSATRADDWDEVVTSRPKLATAVADHPAVSVTIEQTAPAHRGLGSGTQRELAIAAACGLPRDAETLAAATGRGVRSAIGLHGFCQGGFLLDGGRPGGEPIGTLLQASPFPNDWPLLLVRLVDQPGLFGPAEKAAFRRLPPMPESTRRTLRQLAEQTLRAVTARDLSAFTDSLTDYGCHVGDFFTPVQGGRFADPTWNDLLPPLRAAGCGLAQSSWGPTVAIVGDLDAAESLLAGHAPQSVLRTTAMNGPSDKDSPTSRVSNR